jgi:hypothetical protein
MAPEIAAPAGDRTWVLTALALAGLAVVLLFAVIPHTVTADGYVRFQKIETLLGSGTLRGERFSYIGPLFASPFWLFATAGSLLWWCARFNVLVLGAGAVAAWWALRDALPASERASFVLLLVAAGMMPNATRDFYGELFSAVMIGTGLLAVVAREWWPGWIAVVLGVSNMPGCGVALLFVAVARFWKTRRLDGAVALLAATALIALENTITRGTPLDAGYLRDRGNVTVLPFSGKSGFSYPLLLGVLSLLFSFGKGLLFFAPSLLLVPGARRQRPALADFFDSSIVFLIGLLVVYSQWWAWYGGWTWGPRFLLYASYPAALALAISSAAPATAARSIATLGLLAWTVWVGVSGAVFDLEGLEQCIENGYALEHLCWFVPEYSPLLRHFVIPPSAIAPWQQIWMVFAAIAAAVLITSGPSLTRIADGFLAVVRLHRRR